MPLNELIPAETALKLVLDGVDALLSEKVRLVECAGRVLANDLVALRTQPPFDASAMDGYAVRQQDIKSFPVELRLVGTSRAGVPFSGIIEPGDAVRIFTGAVVPDDLDSIIIQENTRVVSPECVQIQEGVAKAKFIRPAGLDFNEGDVLLRKGDVMTPNRIALAASMNHAMLSVHQRPKVALIATGDELVAPGSDLSKGQIIASNTYGLSAAVTQNGGDVLDFGIIEDQKSTLSAAFKSAMESKASVIVTTGGASVGDHDLILPVAKELGFNIRITKIAMRPGKPFIFGNIEHNGQTTYLTGLAGNPVSSLVAFNVFVKPLLASLTGLKTSDQLRQPAKLGCALPENDHRAEYMRGTLSRSEDGELIATPFLTQDSSMLATLVKADCLIYRPVRAAAAEVGEICEFISIL